MALFKSWKENRFALLLAVLGGVGLSMFIVGCATIIHGTTQDIGVSSSPTGATVIVDNTAYGRTPTIIKLSRKHNHIVKINLKGYQPFEATLTRSVSGWVWGNIVFGGFIGLAVDAISGGLYKLTPEQIQATLLKNETGYLYRKNSLYIAVVLTPDPAWQKIATLTKRSGY